MNDKYKCIHDLLFCAVSSHDLKTYLEMSQTEASSNSFDPHSIISDKISKLEEKKKNSQLCDFDLLKLIVNILNYQSAESLKIKHNAFADNPKMYDAYKVPNIMLESDCMIWAREPRWSYIEAVFLSLGFTPNSIIEYDFGKTERHMSFVTSPLINDLNYRLELLEKHSSISGLHNAAPIEFIYWFQSMELSLPEELKAAIKELQKPRNMYGELQGTEKDKISSLSTTERQTLLKLVAAMSIKGYSFDPNASRNHATADIQTDLDFLGLGLDQKTILKWLREAADLIDDNIDL